MKLWHQRSITYKTHIVSALCRSLFTNACWIFSTSLFVKSVGSKGYSQLYFFASLCSLAYYLYFALRGNRQTEPYNVYRAVLLLALLASGGCFLVPYLAVLEPVNDLLLYFFVISVMTVDLVGTTLGPIVLQASVNPAIFRQVYQRIVMAELLARITAAIIVWLLSVTHQLNFLYAIAWLLLILHFVLFGVTVWRMRVSEMQSSISESSRAPAAIENVGSSFRFLFSNPLVRAAMCAMVWATITKFVIENIFYQGADAKFHSAEQLASFVSMLTIVIYSLSLALHHFLNRYLNSRLQLSTLLSIQPVNVLVLSGIALVLPPFWPLVLLMVTYNIIHRSVEMPMSRQCLVPVPRQQRATIVALISIVIAIATIITSGIMAILKSSLHMEDFLVILLVLGSAILFVVTSLDSYYFRNLWSFFQETRSGTWQEDPQADSLLEFELSSQSGGLESRTSTADLAANPILQTYAFSFDNNALQHAVQSHKQLLRADNANPLISALRICFVSNFPWFKTPVAQAASHEDLEVRKFAERASLVDREFQHMDEHSSVVRRKIRAVAMELLETNADERQLGSLKNLLNASDRDAVESLVGALADSRFKELRGLILDCVESDGQLVTVTPIVERMVAHEYANASLYRELLQQLSFGRRNAELRTTIESNLSALNREKLSLGQKRSNDHIEQLQLFMHTLFLEEYRLLSIKADKALTNSIAAFPSFSEEESGILIDMHLSFLKRSELFHSWEAIML